MSEQELYMMSEEKAKVCVCVCVCVRATIYIWHQSD